MKPDRLTLDIEIENALPELARLHQAAEAFLREAKIDEQTCYAVLFALEEVVSNIIQYAYDDQLAHTIWVHFQLTPRTIDVEVEDDGRMFDPSVQATVDTSLPPEQRPIGGLGIFLTRGMAQEMHYRREKGMNRLGLRFSYPLP